MTRRACIECGDHVAEPGGTSLCLGCMSPANVAKHRAAVLARRDACTHTETAPLAKMGLRAKSRRECLNCRAVLRSNGSLVLAPGRPKIRKLNDQQRDEIKDLIREVIKEELSVGTYSKESYPYNEVTHEITLLLGEDVLSTSYIDTINGTYDS